MPIPLLTYAIERYILYITMKNIIEKLRLYRLKNKIKQEKLGEMLEVSFCTINRWFNNKQKPNEIQTYAIAELLKKKWRRSK